MYKVRINLNLEKTLKYIPKKDKEQIIKFIDNLDNIIDPFVIGKKIKGYESLYRYRVGNYRILCNINSTELLILIIDIAHRKEIYKHL